MDLANFILPAYPCQSSELPGQVYLDIIAKNNGVWPGAASVKIINVITVAPGDETDLLNKVYSNGPASVLIDASHNRFQLYTGGV
jgi:hypothetical protein